MPRHKRRCTNENSDSEDEEPILKTLNNTIYYRGDITMKTATEFCIELEKLSLKLAHSADHIRLFLTTDGGNVFAGIVMYEAIKRCKVDVHVICEACVASSGTLVMLGAKKRSMYSTCVIMVHALSSMMMGMHKPKEIREELHNTETLLSIMTHVYKKHTKMKKQILDSMYDKDMYMTAPDCVRLGFVDEVLD